MVRIAVILGLVLCPLVAADIHGASLQGERERQPRPGAEEPKPTEPPEETKTFKVSGKVVDRDGEPQGQAKVSFDGPKRGEAWTGRDGAFSFEGPAGDYRVTVKIGSKQPQAFSVKITESGLQPSVLEIDDD
jgi:carboxypeptidase family protein